MAELQGRWELVAFEEKGDKGDFDEQLVVTVKDDEMTFRRGTDDPIPVRFKIDPSKTPAYLDLILDADKKEVCHAIYRIEKGELTICVGTNFSPNKSSQRPQEFATVLGSEKRPPKGKLMFTFKRAK
ncbi:MAG TPA: TIGR03067 domain-containing protein [Gemmataceae bacterium]|nr:TIGR03067 domain-containing protein [Gemmataceae bacterium]